MHGSVHVNFMISNKGYSQYKEPITACAFNAILSISIYYSALFIIFIYLVKDKDVRVVAVGIGRGIDKGTLLSIADNKDDQVVEVENFSQLEKEMNTIKSKACSGKFKSASPFF